PRSTRKESSAASDVYKRDGYSIIGQGQVEKILSGKIEDSRELFDEAAGIAKLKKNRSVTEKSLEQEHQNLERVTDVLSELEKQVGPLEQQSKKAREYLKLKEQEKDLDIHLFLYDQDHAREELTENRRQHDIVKNDLDQTRTSYDRLKEKNASLREESESLAHKIEQTETEKDALVVRKEELDSKTLEHRHSMESNQRMIVHYEEIIQQSRSEKEAKQRQLEEQQGKCVLEENALAGYHEEQEKIQAAKERLEEQKANISAKITTQRDALYTMMDDQLDTKEKMSRYDAMEEQLHIRNAEYNSRLLSLQSELKDYNGKAAQLESELEQTREAFQEAREAGEREQVHAQALEEEARQLSARLDQENQDYLRARSKYETLAGITERYEGYNSSIKHIMEHRKNQPGVIGVVADIIELDKEYETAIEIALGGALQNVVTENDQVARQMIAWLKQNRYGRATFLPLTSIRRRNSTIHPLILEEEGVIGIASDLVKVEKRFDALVQSLLGRTIVVDHVDNALMLSRKNNYSLRIVTIGGELLNPGGSITGGAYRHSGNLLGRKREMEECKERMRQAEKSCVDIKKKITGLQEEKKAEEGRLEERQKEISRLQLTLHDLGHQIPELFEKENELKASIDQLKKEHELLQKQLQDIQTEREMLSQDQQHHEKIHEENNDAIEQLEKELSHVEERIRQTENEENQMILHISQAEQQMEFYHNDYERLQGEMENCDSNILANETQKRELERQNKESEEQIVLLTEKIAALTADVQRISDELDGLKADRNAITKQQNVMFQELEEQNERLLLLEKEETRLTARREKLETDMQTQIDYMWDNYEITYIYARQHRQYAIRPTETAEYRRQKKEITQQIRQLGNVNINAIEEYKEVGERYTFLRGQYDDIMEAEENLQGMIRDLNTAMQKQFAEKFEEIRAMFADVFQDLFEGGTANLQLMDEDDMLECGIRIVAQPPGKKLQNIMLLSGGERALTAIALLFAIQKLKPSPFCLLDEIEAALDDANIVRFSKYLKRLSAETQFIVITHRRGTMSAADALYGITMQEKGVSTLISVDLIDKELEA
ncbi:MAG: chromosome segregation protein SMC, partial [Clostridiales bacterium]|nr:chromosome segregation protein SMC [Clostridiales bacterium]